MTQSDSAVQECSFDSNDRFTYIEKISTGISGEVLLGGRDRQTGVDVVIKQPNKISSREERERHAVNIWREARALERLAARKERSVCRLLDSGREVDRETGITTHAYMVTTRATGQPLDVLAEEYRRPDKDIPWPQVFAIMERLTALLARAHQADLIYNDVKPEHIFWDQSAAELTLIDWGNVVFYDREKEVQPSTDVRQVAELLYKLVTGVRPNGTTLDFGEAQLPEGLREVIGKALDDGYSTMAALHRDVKKVQYGEWQKKWREVVAYLRSADYVKANLLLQDLVAGFDLSLTLPEESKVYLFHTLTDWALREGAPITKIEELIEEALAEREIETLKSGVEMLSTSRSEDFFQVYRVVYWLSRLTELPTVHANVTWLERQLEELEREFQQNNVARRNLKEINVDLLAQIEALAPSETDFDRLLQAYREVAAVLRRTSDYLTELSPETSSDLQGMTDWLARGSHQLSVLLLDLKHALSQRNRSKCLELLATIEDLDLSNSQLQAWVNTVRDKLTVVPIREAKHLRELPGLTAALHKIESGKFAEAFTPLQSHVEQGSLKPTMPEYAYHEALKTIFHGIEGWRGGEYADAYAEFVAAKEVLDSLRETSPGKELYGYAERLQQTTTTILEDLSQAYHKGMTTSPTDSGVWQLLETTLQTVAQSIIEHSSLRGKSLHVEEQLEIHRKLSETYPSQPSLFVENVAQLRLQRPPHPFLDIYDAWAALDLSDGTATSEAVESTDLDLTVVEELICEKRLREAQEVLERLQQESPQAFKTTVASVYQRVIKHSRKAWMALIAGNYAAAVSMLGQTLTVVEDLPQREVRTVLLDKLANIKSRIEVAAERLNGAVKYVEQEHMSRPGSAAWERLRSALEINVKELAGSAGDGERRILQKQVELHQGLYEAYSNKDLQSYARHLNEWERYYKQHPYTPLYRTWRESVREKWYGWLPKYAWVALAFVVLLLLVGGGVALTVGLGGIGERTTPTLTITPQVPTSTALETQSSLTETCATMQKSAQAEDWQAVLEDAEATWEIYGQNLVAELGAVSGEPCDFTGMLVQAGKELTRAAYSEGNYEAAGDLSRRTLALLEEVSPSTMESEGYRDLDIIHACAEYKYSIEAEDLDGAEGALDEVEDYEASDGFYNAFLQYCGLSLDQARAALIPPTPTSTPRIGTGGDTVTPEHAGVCVPRLPSSLWPSDEPTKYTGQPVDFSWEGGQICENQVWRVSFDGVSSCTTTSNSVRCQMPAVEGAYRWRVEIWEDDQPVPDMMSPGLLIHVEGGSSDQDRDGDGIPDSSDKCPEDKGPNRNSGCP